MLSSARHTFLIALVLVPSVFLSDSLRAQEAINGPELSAPANAPPATPAPPVATPPQPQAQTQPPDAANPALADLVGLRFLSTTDGALMVASVEPKGPLGNSGLRAGDQILAINGVPVASAEAIYRWVPTARTDAASAFVVRREGREVILTWTPTATVVQRIPVASRPVAAPYLGLHVFEHVPDATVVARVDRNSPAEKAGIRPDDVITALNDRRIAGPNDYAAAAAELSPNAPVRFAFSRVATTTAGGVVTQASADLPPSAAPAASPAATANTDGQRSAGFTPMRRGQQQQQQQTDNSQSRPRRGFFRRGR